MAYDSHDHGVYTRRYFCASNSSVSEHITLDSDLRPMIMNYHEIIREFASCRVGLKEVEKLEQNIDVNKTPCSMSQSIRPKMCSEIRRGGALDNFLAYF